MNTETLVSAEEPAQPTPAAPAAPAQPAPATVDAAKYEKDMADLREQVAEANRTAAFWAEQARSGATPAQPEPEPEPEDDDTDVLEAITTNGTKGFDALAAKRGFIKRDEVQSMIDNRANAIIANNTKETELLGRYPDLKDKNTPFFKATANYYGGLVRGGTPQHIAMELAAEKTELEFMREGKIPSGKTDREADRLARIAAQSGGAGPRRPAAGESDDDTLTPEQKHIAAQMGISEEAYLKRAKAGVRMGGKPAHRDTGRQ